MRQLDFTVAMFVCLFCVATATAQDTVKMVKGASISGDVVKETFDEVHVVLQSGELKKLAKVDVKEIRRGAALNAKVQQWLDTIDPKKADDLFGVADRAAKEKDLLRDAQRIARRVLAIDQNHAGARKLLGHAKVAGTWYTDLSAARREGAKALASKGYVIHKSGFAKKSDIEDIDKNPLDWQLTEELLWRRTADLLREQGKISFGGEWYANTDEDLVKELEVLRDRTGDTAQAARVGATYVFSAVGRANATEMAGKLQKTREWFAETFKVRPEEYVATPVTRFYVMSDKEKFEKFLDGYKDDVKAADVAIKLYKAVGQVPFPKFNRACHKDVQAWEYTLVSGTGSTMFTAIWSSGVKVPDAMMIAAGHLAEIAILGGARVEYVAPDEYGRQRPLRESLGRDIGAFRGEARAALASGITVRQLFGTKMNDMSSEMDSLGVAVLAFLLEQKNEQAMMFIKEGRGTKIDDRVEAAFKMSIEKLEEAIKGWL